MMIALDDERDEREGELPKPRPMILGLETQ